MRSARLLAAALALAFAAEAHAAPILDPPGAPGYDAALGDLARGYQRQQDVFATLENGLALDCLFQPAEVQTVKDFFAQTASDDFQLVTGKHPYAVLAEYGEYGDEGNFAGITSVGVAARLMVLRAAGAPQAELDAARRSAVRAAQAWHVYGAIGGPGVVARGVRRLDPWSSGDPPFPGTAPALTPLKDAAGDPLPAPKAGVWRAPVGAFPGWVWMDDTSKDQVSGYALAAAWLWDALHDDPAVPAQVSADLAADLAAFARALMQVAPELGIDLCIRDADGRLTSFHDLNPRQIDPNGVLPETTTLRNGFNAALALGIVRAAYHVSGDPEIGKFYYEDLVGKRDLPGEAASNAGVIFLGASTNFSNVNMLAIALATLGRFETDAKVRAKIQLTLDKQFWQTGSDRDVWHTKQAWFDVIYGAYGSLHPAEIRARVAENLAAFQSAPAFERDVVNCDAAEIAALSCLAVDGKTVIELLPSAGHNGIVVAKDIVPKALRPDSDFEWRSDPHRVNGSGSTLMDHGGDWLTAYWLARGSDLEDADLNLSPSARPPLPYTEGGGGAGGSGGAGGAGGSSSSSSSSSGAITPAKSGCSCGTAGSGDDAAGLALAALALAVASRRRRASRAAR
jgi:MYXO-CTERM domain-containing protein